MELYKLWLYQKHLNLKVVAFKPIEGHKKAVKSLIGAHLCSHT